MMSIAVWIKGVTGLDFVDFGANVNAECVVA